MTTANPTRDEFAALLEESFGDNDVLEGAVVKGTITAIEKDLAVIDQRYDDWMKFQRSMHS